MESKVLRIKDLACPDCAKNIEQVLKRNKGIFNAEVSFMTGKLTVDYDPGVINLDDIKKTVGKLGYELAE
ncbi:MAG: hypothetical protein HPY66_1124 [Firmicutes bacterium]|nr:hypothetical protein [Bacillota bacterium]